MMCPSLPKIVLAGVLFSAVGCGLKGEDLSVEGQAIVSDATESDVTIGIATALSAVPSLPLSGAQMTLSAAVASQADVAKYAQPAGCLTTSVAGNVVTYTFDHCTGPWGLVKVTGQETATFSPGDAGAVVVDLASQSLEADGIPIEHDAHVTISFQAGVRQVTWLGSYAGTTAKGRKVKHSSDLTLLADANQCFTLKGTTDTTIGLRGLSVQYEGLERCGARTSCPTGTVVATGKLSRMRVTLTFDGTTEGLATGQLGGEKSFPIDCTPQKP